MNHVFLSSLCFRIHFLFPTFFLLFHSRKTRIDLEDAMTRVMIKNCTNNFYLLGRGMKKDEDDAGSFFVSRAVCVWMYQQRSEFFWECLILILYPKKFDSHLYIFNVKKEWPEIFLLSPSFSFFSFVFHWKRERERENWIEEELFWRLEIGWHN